MLNGWYFIMSGERRDVPELASGTSQRRDVLE